MDVQELESQGRWPLERRLAAVGVAVMAAASSLIWYVNPSNVNFFPACPLFSMTGLACPGCGMTRGFHALFHGDVIAALDYNAMIPFFSLLFGFFFVSMLLVAVRGKALTKWTFSPKPLFAFFILLIVFGVVRNLPYYPFTFLYP